MPPDARCAENHPLAEHLKIVVVVHVGGPVQSFANDALRWPSVPPTCGPAIARPLILRPLVRQTLTHHRIVHDRIVTNVTDVHAGGNGAGCLASSILDFRFWIAWDGRLGAETCAEHGTVLFRWSAAGGSGGATRLRPAPSTPLADSSLFKVAIPPVAGRGGWSSRDPPPQAGGGEKRLIERRAI